MATIVKSIGARGIEGFQVDVEVQIFSGVALMNIVVNLSPSDIKKSGTYFDLLMLVGILLESEQVNLKDFCLSEYAIFGELGLNGELKSFSGVFPLVIAPPSIGINSHLDFAENP